MRNKPKASVFIPTKNRCKALKRCLDSLLKQTYKNFEVVIVDDESTDGTKDLVNKFSKKLNINFIFQKKQGLVSAVNQGLKNSKGDIFIRTDDDVVMYPKWIEGIVEIFNSSDKVGGVTGPTIIPKESKEHRDLFKLQQKFQERNFLWKLLGKIYFNYFMEGKPRAVSKWFKSGAFSLGSNYEDCLKLDGPIEVEHHEACNMAVRRDLLEKIGGFDEVYGGLGEYNEADVSFKIRKLGYKIIFNPKARVDHIPSREGFFKERPNSYSRILNFINFYFRHIKPNTLDKFVRFFSYLLFLNGFWVYKFITTKRISQLGCISGTIVGLAKNVFRISSWKVES